MARYEFRLPDVGEGVTEAEISQWHVAAGDRIDENSALVDVSTDKAIVDITSPVTGMVLAIHGAVGEKIPVGSVLVVLEIEELNAKPPVQTARDDEAASPAPHIATAPCATPPAAVAPTALTKPPTSHAERGSSLDAPLAAPATRHRAKELGISIDSVPGTNPDGRILPQDVE